MRRYFYLLFLLPFSGYANLTSEQSQNLQEIRDAWWAVDSSSDYSNAVGMRRYFTQILANISSWGGNWINTTGNAAAKFIQEFGMNGWFPAVKASIAVIQADVGRINTALTTANDHLETIEGDVSSIKYHTESIDTSVTSISSDTSSIKSSASNISSSLSDLLTSFSSFWDDSYFGNGYTFFNFRRLIFPKSDSSSGILNASDFQWDEYETDATSPITAIIHLLQANAQAWEDHFTFTASELMRLSVQQYCIEVLTNTTQQILDTNSFWYAKIYDRISTNQVFSSHSNNVDWVHGYQSPSRSPLLAIDPLTPLRDADVADASEILPPELTGDFRHDVVALLDYCSTIGVSQNTVQMDMLTNLQVVANSILSASAVVQDETDKINESARSLVQDYDSHSHDLDSQEDNFALVPNNESAKSHLQSADDVKGALNKLDFSDVPSSYSFDISVPFSSFRGDSSDFGDYFHIEVDVSQIRDVCRSIRAVFAVFWWVIGFGVLFGLLGRGLRLLTWISGFINPAVTNSSVSPSPAP